jgi:hypothetical protein
MWSVSKRTFIDKHIVPANENDRFMDSKYSFCWNTYDDEAHPPVRVLPCNHIFGKACIRELIDKSASGDRCPICRTPWFRPTGRKLAEICYEYCAEGIMSAVVFPGLCGFSFGMWLWELFGRSTSRAVGFVRDLCFYLMLLCMHLLDGRIGIPVAKLLIAVFTELHTETPDLEWNLHATFTALLWMERFYVYAWSIVSYVVRRWVLNIGKSAPGYSNLPILLSILVVLPLVLEVLDTLPRTKDRCHLVGALTVGVILDIVVHSYWPQFGLRSLFWG